MTEIDTRVARRAPRRNQPASRGLQPRQRGLLLLVAIGGLTILLAVMLFSCGGASPAQQVAQNYVRAWARGDYVSMYFAADRATRRRMSVDTFAAQNGAAMAEATVTSAAVAGTASASGDTVTVPVRIHTRIFGTLNERFAIPTTGGDHPQVRWSSSLVFPGLKPGETLSRHTTMPQRAQLLARNGTPLAQVTAASNIIGSLGPIPPDRAAAYRALGYPPDATVGIDGLQREFESRLAGSPGGELLAGARVIGSGLQRPGENVRTTISPAMQSLAVSTLGGLEGGIVALLPRTGEIVAVAGTPFSDLQPPGSTFKIVTLTGALIAGIAKPATVFPYATTSTIDGFTLHNANDENCGGTLANAFAVSCNSVFAPLGAKLGAAALVDAAQRFGFNRPSPISSVAESTIPPSSLQSNLDVGSSAIGQGEVQATTLQMALVAATIADGGLRPTPTLATDRISPPVRAVPPTVARQVRQMMVGVVSFGTGTSAQIPGVVVAGKTGTAELATTVSSSCDPSTQNCPTANDPRNTDAWFVAFAPARRPRIAVGVLLPHNGAGGSTAAPLAQTILQQGLARTANGGGI